MEVVVVIDVKASAASGSNILSAYEVTRRPRPLASILQFLRSDDSPLRMYPVKSPRKGQHLYMQGRAVGIRALFPRITFSAASLRLGSSGLA